MTDTILQSQPAKFAGTFYPANPEELTHSLNTMLMDKSAQTPGPPKILIMPHAGYRYSGNTAALAIAEARGDIQRVVIVGPTHRFAFDGIAAPEALSFDTPNGEIFVDQRAMRLASRLPFVKEEPRAFDDEHCIEVELPWVKHVLKGARVAPFVVGRATTEQVKQLIAQVWGDERTLIVISTDLSHFLDAKSATIIDRKTAGLIETKDFTEIGHENACGWLPLRGLLALAQERQIRLTRLDLTNSGKVTGDDTRVVGYGAWAGHLSEFSEYSEANREKLYRVAANAIHQTLLTKKSPNMVNYSNGHLLQSFGASFVTLVINGRLRGCIGTLKAHQPLVNDVFLNSANAAFRDPRFPPVTLAEFEHLECEIAVLGAPAPLAFSSKEDLLEKMNESRSGIILSYQNHRATFLPKVWEDIYDAEDFLSTLMKKAGLEEDFWSNEITIEQYSTERFPKVLLKDMI